MQSVVKQMFHWMPLVFGIGFIAPLIAQIMAVWQIGGPFGLSRIAVGLVIGVPWGWQTVIRGRWI